MQILLRNVFFIFVLIDGKERHVERFFIVETIIINTEILLFNVWNYIVFPFHIAVLIKHHGMDFRDVVCIILMIDQQCKVIFVRRLDKFNVVGDFIL